MFKFNQKTINKSESVKWNFNVNRINGLVGGSIEVTEEGVPPLTVTSLAGNLANYKIYGNSRQSPLPQGFKQVEYIQSTGTQYINTGYTFNPATDIVRARVAINEPLSAQDKFFVSPVSWNTPVNTRFALGGFLNEKFAFAYGGVTTGNTIYNPQTSIDNNFHNYEYTNYTFSVTDLGLTGSAVNITFNTETDTELRLFYGYATPTRCKISSYQHIRNGITLVDWVSALDKNNVPCMYDKVTGTAVYNNGTGSFTAGEDVTVNPTPSNPIQVESVGYYNLWNGVVSNFTYVLSPSRVSINTANYRSIVVPYETGQQITITRDVAIGNRFTGFFTKEYPVADTPVYSITNVPTSSLSANFSSNEPDLKYLVIYFSVSAEHIEQGNIKATYTGKPYAIPVTISSNNIWDGEITGFSYGILPDRVLGSRTGVSNRSIVVPYETGQQIKVSRDIAIGNRFTGFFTKEYPVVNLPAYDATIYDSTALSHVFSSNEPDLKYLVVYFSITGQDILPSNIKANIIENTEVLLDEPLRKIGDYVDYIDFENQKVVRKIGVQKTDSSYDWSVGNNFVFSPERPSDIASNNPAITGTDLIFCDKFKNSTANVAFGNTIRNRGSNLVGVVIYPQQDIYNSWNTWIAENTITLTYIKQTTSETPIALPTLPSFNGQTTYTIDTDINASNMFIKYTTIRGVLRSSDDYNITTLDDETINIGG